MFDGLTVGAEDIEPLNFVYTGVMMHRKLNIGILRVFTDMINSVLTKSRLLLYCYYHLFQILKGQLSEEVKSFFSLFKFLFTNVCRKGQMKEEGKRRRSCNF